MSYFDTLHTPDYSPLVVHFTKSHRMVREELITDIDPLFGYRQSPAFDRLKSIVQSRTIHASPMNFVPTDPRAVCFTECVWEGLTRLAEQYSSYGVVFSKRFIFDQGGGPALYIRGDKLLTIGNGIPPVLYPFIAPFDPEATIRAGVALDFLQEREWRLPNPMRFEYADIEYVIVNSLADADSLVYLIGAQHLPEDKVIPIEVYKTIKRAWSER